MAVRGIWTSLRSQGLIVLNKVRRTPGEVPRQRLSEPSPRVRTVGIITERGKSHQDRIGKLGTTTAAVELPEICGPLPFLFRQQRQDRLSRLPPQPRQTCSVQAVAHETKHSTEHDGHQQQSVDKENCQDLRIGAGSISCAVSVRSRLLSTWRKSAAAKSPLHGRTSCHLMDYRAGNCMVRQSDSQGLTQGCQRR